MTALRMVLTLIPFAAPSTWVAAGVAFSSPISFGYAKEIGALVARATDLVYIIMPFSYYNSHHLT